MRGGSGGLHGSDGDQTVEQNSLFYVSHSLNKKHKQKRRECSNVRKGTLMSVILSHTLDIISSLFHEQILLHRFEFIEMKDRSGALTILFIIKLYVGCNSMRFAF